YVYATQKHGDQKRASGAPYYSHPVEVAGILTELHLDTASIATALLHDTIEDTDATFGEIEKVFGREIADMVNGVTKMSLLELSSADAAQAENFRKLLLATASDVRILLVKLADRLHNMRTLNFISAEEKRLRIAQETLDIYAPLAGRIGMQNFREELEDLAFAEVNVEGRALIVERLKELKQDSGDMLDAIAYEFSALLGENTIKAHVYGRQKRPFSIWRKMQNKSISLEQLSDVFGYRVVVADEAACYQALGVLHRNFSYVPGRYKDYISTPKLNGYQSLHTTIIGPNQQRVEVQIRTEQMDEIAQKGVAAHWAYKDKQEEYPDIAKIEPFNGLQDMVGRWNNGGSAEEFLENAKLELVNAQVFCFTPKGRLIAMPRGATALDFAYAVHTEIGNSCIGVRINGLKLPFRTLLKNGDEIEIIRREGQLPGENWLNHVHTGKARAAIRHALREREAADFIKLGRQMVDNLFAAEAVDSTDTVLERALGVLSIETLDALFENVGRGAISAADVLLASMPKKALRKRDRFAGAMRSLIGRPAKFDPHDSPMLPINGALHGTVVNVAENCFPLPGDEIVGIVTPGSGVVVYPSNARELAAFEDSRERWVPMRWEGESEALFASRVQLTAVNRTGSLSVITQTIADFDANITNLSMIHLNEDFCDLTVDVEVRDKEHMEQLVNALKGSRVISEAKRVIFGGAKES
ncbi:MAG: bifunctional (p)ppGpp synthetase/guanosine-3',5'-bis(diphosphate) 3'-pyrophosphohydrolase, partial [Alphaproteobacteria bacterium]|nr:bifunctional (p)ppGpp synthetase/guanosine-3',5'-bis(diphosphate) 3'-pyrophosphohydrolase [Alphaproteobacteria bacterium]